MVIGVRDQYIELYISRISNEFVYVLNIGLVFIWVFIVSIYMHDKGFYLINGFYKVVNFVRIDWRIGD